MFAQSPFIGSCSILGFGDDEIGIQENRRYGKLIIYSPEESVRVLGDMGEKENIFDDKEWMGLNEEMFNFWKDFKGVREILYSKKLLILLFIIPKNILKLLHRIIYISEI